MYNECQRLQGKNKQKLLTIERARSTDQPGLSYSDPELRMPEGVKWLPQQRSFGYSKTYVSFIIPIHISTNAENAVKIGLYRPSSC